MMSKQYFSGQMDNERGAVLFVVLIMLILLTMVGLSSMSTSTTEVSLSGNYTRTQNAFYAADSALELAKTYNPGTSTETHNDVSISNLYNADISAQYLTVRLEIPPADSGYSLDSALGAEGKIQINYYVGTARSESVHATADNPGASVELEAQWGVLPW